MQKNNHILYRPLWKYVILDSVLLIVSIGVVLLFFPLQTKLPFVKYYDFAILFSILWLVCSYLTRRYVVREQIRLGRAGASLLLSAGLQFGLMMVYSQWMARGASYSIFVLLTIWLIMLGLCAIAVTMEHAYRYALDTEEEINREPDRIQSVAVKDEPLGDIKKQQLQTNIIKYASANGLRYLEQHVNLYFTHTFVIRTAELFNIQNMPAADANVIVNLMPLNQVRGINNMFGVVNDKLTDHGLYVCCFLGQSTVKRNILAKYPKGLNWILYTGYSLYKRVLPRLFMTSRLYFDITEGKNRVLSRTEVLGRLCYCGFSIVDMHKVGDLLYVVAKREFTPSTTQRRLYGPFIKLNRVGKDGKLFTVYKFRTMHPYSEFIQKYIYERYSLREGGKFSHDIRITSLGRFMRKCWIDEWPMWINVFKGNMKIVGVRPISQQYYSLYSKELQEKRIHHKPGLLPPFYADMPKTLEEIEASEMRYLTLCEQKGTCWVDIVYFWKIIYMILIKRARSN